MKASHRSVVYGDDDVPLDKLKYNVTPRLVTLLTFAHRRADAAAALRFSY